MNKYDAILSYFNELYPNASCELNYANDIQLLIAVVLSAQTTDKMVNKVTFELFKAYPTCKDMIRLKESDIEKYIKKLGLYRNKSKNVFKLIRIIYDDYDSKVPSDYHKLIQLPGVGRKTANVMLAEYFKIPAIAVDTHVERVSKRLKIAFLNDTPLNVEKKLMKNFPTETWIKLHHQFIHFGRYFCKSQNPNCIDCKLKTYCRNEKMMKY